MRFLGDGHWVAMHKAGVSHLPRDRAYSKVEAMFSLSVDRDEGTERTVREYARIWRWSPNRVHRFLKRSLTDSGVKQTRNSNEYRAVQREFKYVAGLRRPVGQESGQESEQNRVTTHENIRNPRIKHRNAPKLKRAWWGLSKRLDDLLACDEYIAHLAKRSPVLAHWSAPEIRAWAREVVARGATRRAREKKPAITSFAHYLEQCVDRVQAWEKPVVTTETPPALLEAAEAMRIGGPL